jgi:DNA-directed RNA polymerase specialized sigma24 family protein
MSVTLSLPDEQKYRKQKSRIWLSEVDSRGIAVDPRFIEAAYRKESEFFRYRTDKLKDEAVVANLAEEAVYCASRAAKKEPLRDVSGYLFKVFCNLADKEIARSPQTISYEPQLLENFPKARMENGQQIIDHIQIREILDELDPDLRWAIRRRTLGFEVQEIAKAMNISADCLSTRMRRGLRQTLHRLLDSDLR